MDFKKFENKIFFRIDKGEEIVNSVKHICKELNIKTGTITGLGATDKITIGIFNINTKKYHTTEFTGDHEISQLYGNISSMSEDVYLHIHVTICDIKHQSFGGHLNSAIVSATFEGVIEEIDGKVNRSFDGESGLNLIKF